MGYVDYHTKWIILTHTKWVMVTHNKWVMVTIILNGSY